MRIHGHEAYPSAPAVAALALSFTVPFAWRSTAGTFLPAAPMTTAREAQSATLLHSGKVLVVGGNQGQTNALASAELYDPATGTWTLTGSLGTARYSHSASLLTNGQVLVTGGTQDGTNGLASAELYDPATGMWTPTGPLTTARFDVPSGVLTNGLVLVAGGITEGTNYLASAELYNPATGVWTPTGPLGTGRALYAPAILTNGLVLVAGGRSDPTNYLASAELYDPATGTWRATRPMAGPRASAGGGLLRNGLLLVAGGRAGPTNYLASAELYDPATGTWAPTSPLNTSRYGVVNRLLPDGTLLVAGGFNGNWLSSAEVYDPIAARWTVTPALNTARAGGMSVRLPDGRVLVTGGTVNGRSLAGTELYDPAGVGWAPAGSLGFARYDHEVTLLTNNQVLVTGGTADHITYLAVTERYDPVGGGWAGVGFMTYGRAEHTATLLANGHVLAAGGYQGSVLSAAELYDPSTLTWTTTSFLNTPRYEHTATLLPSGKLLVAGGSPDTQHSTSSAELYDPATGVWTLTGAMITGRVLHTATLLHSGKVLVAGGYGSGFLSSAELFDPAVGTWSATGSLSTGRIFHTATLLTNGNVLVVGGVQNGTNFLSSAELYTAGGTWTTSAPLTFARELHTATLLADGKVLVAGGWNSFSGFQASVELYDPAARAWSVIGTLQTARDRHKAVLLADGRVLIVGGFSNGAALASAEVFDPARPRLTITTPTSGLRVSNAVFTANGTTSDNVQVTDVQYRLNGGSWTHAATANGWTNWTANLMLAPGTNLFRAFATDASGNHSATGSVSFVYVASDRLMVRTTGQGTLTPNYSNAVLELGKNYSMKGHGINGFVFADWVISTNWVGGVATNSPSVQFIMQSNLTLQADFLDVTPPALKITSPTPKQRWSNAVFTVSGTAKDNGPLAGVWCLTNGVWGLATTSNSWTNWSVNVSLAPGTNLVQAYAVDAAGNRSPTNSVSFIYVLSAPLTLISTGQGALSPNYSNALLQVGTLNRITATASVGYLFSNWLGTAGQVLTNGRTLQFMMQSNLVLTANFVPNPFIRAAGSYQGLFYDTNGVEQASSGLFSSTVSSNGTFSAKFQQGANSIPVAGQFSLAGAWQTNFIKGWTNVSAWLQLDLAGGDTIIGSLGNASWTAELAANRALYSKANPAPEVGKYTLVLPGSTNASVEPGGNGYATVNVQTNGNVSLNGTLGDGTKVSQSAFVSKTGQWAVYVPLYLNQGSLLGWLTFTNQPDSDLEGLLNWIKPARTVTNLYPAGFTNQTEAVGSLYTLPSGARGLDLTNGLLILENGNLAQALTNEFTLRSDDTALGTNGLSLAITNSTGLFQGSVTNPVTGKAVKYSGAVFQKRNAAYGLFIGTTESGSVLLEAEE